MHNHPGDHHHHGHNGDDAHHHGEETTSFSLNPETIEYLNSLVAKVLKIRVEATVFDDPPHHHHAKPHEGPAADIENEDEDDEDADEGEGEDEDGDCDEDEDADADADGGEGQGRGKPHDHIHHSSRLSPPPFAIETGQLRFTFGGPATTDQRRVAEEPLINLGTLVSGARNSLNFNDEVYYTIKSEEVAEALDYGDGDASEFGDDNTSFRHLVEFEATSDQFAFPRIDTISVPIVIQTNKSRNAQLRLFVFGPGGYRSAPDLVKEIRAPNIDRAFNLQIPRKDVAYLNTLLSKSLKVKIRVSLNSEFQVATDSLRFIATTTDYQEQPVRTGLLEYIDPGLRNPEMAEMPADTGYLLRVKNVQPGLMNINWAFDSHNHEPGAEHKHGHADQHGGGVSIQVYEGLVVGEPSNPKIPGPLSPNNGDLVAINPGRIIKLINPRDNALVAEVQVDPHHGTSFVNTGFFQVDTGVYTVVYFNGRDHDEPAHGGPQGVAEAFTVISKPFIAPGSGSGAAFKQSTGIFGSVYKDYVIRSDSGVVSLKAVVRQIPGPVQSSTTPWETDNIAWAKNLVLIQSWGEPVDLAPVVVDSDSDGIHDKVDGWISGGSFLSDSGQRSARFTDQHHGGVTSGYVEQRAGLDVRVRDLNDPDDGVLIRATGQGNAVASISVCGFTLHFAIGDAAKATCGPLTLEVTYGAVEATLTGDLVAKISLGAVAKIIHVTSTIISIENLPQSNASLFVIGGEAEVEIMAGTSVTLQDGAPLPSQGPTSTPTPTPTMAPSPVPAATPSATPLPAPGVTPTPRQRLHRLSQHHDCIGGLVGVGRYSARCEGRRGFGVHE